VTSDDDRLLRFYLTTLILDSTLQLIVLIITSTKRYITHLRKVTSIVNLIHHGQTIRKRESPAHLLSNNLAHRH
jgi:hypothetical protein